MYVCVYILYACVNTNEHHISDMCVLIWYTVRDTYLRSGTGFILTYSVVDRISFEKIPSLHQQIIRAKGAEPDEIIPCVIIGNKCDLDCDDRVTLEEGMELAEKLQADFFETSAKQRENIDECYYALVQRIHSIEREQAATSSSSSSSSSSKGGGAHGKRSTRERKGTALGNILRRIGRR